MIRRRPNPRPNLEADRLEVSGTVYERLPDGRWATLSGASIWAPVSPTEARLCDALAALLEATARDDG